MSSEPGTDPPARGSAGDMLFGMGSKILYAVTRVGLPPLALAHMGLAEYGLWSACFVLVGYIGMAASGFTLVYLRTTAQHHAKSDIPAIGRLLSTGILSMGTLATLLLGGLWLGLPWLLNFFHVEPDQQPLATDLWLGAVAVFLADMSLGAFANVLHAIGRLRQEQQVWMAAFLVEAALIVGFLSLGWGVRGLLAAFAGRYLFSASMNAWLAFRALPGLRLSFASFDPSLLRLFFGFGAGMQISGLIATALHSADRMFASALLGPESTALVDLAAKLPVTAGALSSGASSVAESASARHEAHGEHQALRAVYLDATRITVASLALSMPFLACFSAPRAMAWLGNGRTDAQILVVPLMAMLAVGMHLHMLTGPANAVNRGLGRLIADYTYHGMRILTLAIGVGVWYAWGVSTTPTLVAAIALAQCTSAIAYLAYSHRQLNGSWEGMGARMAVPTAAAYALAWSIQAVLPLSAGTGRASALLTLIVLSLIWFPAAATLLGALLLTPAERASLRSRVQGLRLWRRT